MQFLSPSSAIFVSDTASSSGAETARAATPSASLTAVSFLAVTGSNFSWPGFTTPAPQTWNTVEEADKYIFNTIEERDPTAAESATYIPKLEALPATQTVINGVLVNYRDITPVMSEVAHLQITTDKLQGQFQTAMGDNASSDVISAGEDYLGKGVSFGTLREAIFNSDAEKSAINTVYQEVHGQAANDTDQQYAKQQLFQNGITFQQFRINEAHSWRATDELKQVIRDIQDREPGDYDNGWIQSQEDQIGNGQQTFGSVRHGLIYNDGENGIFDSYEQKLYGVNADDPTRTWLQSNLDDGKSLREIRVIDAHSSRMQDTLMQLIRDVQGREPASSGSDESFIQSWMNDLGNGNTTLATLYSGLASYDDDLLRQQVKFVTDQDVGADDSWVVSTKQQIGNRQETLASARNNLINSDRANAAFDVYEQRLYAVNAGSADRDWLRSNLNSGTSLSGIRVIDAHSDRMQGTLNQLIRDVQGREPTPTGDEQRFIQSWMNDMGNNTRTLNQTYSELATYDDGILKQQVKFVTGQDVGSDDSWVSGSIQQIGNRQTTYWGAVMTLTQSDRAHGVIQDVYADWGQLPPDAAALQTAGTALYNLSYAWTTTIQNQTADQLAVEAAAYTPSVSVSFQDMVNDLASSTNQALGLEANLLTNPYLESGATIDETRALMAAGGKNVFAPAIDESSVLVEIKELQQDKTDDCDPLQFRKNTSIVRNISNETDIKPANQSFDIVNGQNWSQSYKDNGIHWKSNGGRGDDQGLPYEAWVQNQLNPSQDPKGIVWLQDEKANWRTFDHWDRDNGVAISDKTIDLQMKWYQDNPTAVTARVMASAYKMTRYDEDQSKIGSNTSVSFTQGDINSYTLNIGVPYITDPDKMSPVLQKEWEALCRGYHRAKIKIPEKDGKTISIQIDTVS
ncbi:hypothetical protein [Acetobacter tropicalis]|nr:hypothetical protein [Acetobacter tropicalis]